MQKDLSLLLVGIVLALATPRDAFAYLDPGTGSLIFSMAAAGFFAALFTVKTYWRRLKAFARSLFNKTAATSVAAEAAEHGCSCGAKGEAEAAGHADEQR